MTLKDIPQETPKAWADFQQYYIGLLNGYDVNLSTLTFLSLPFEMQFGVYVSYFKDQGLDIDVPQWDIEMLQVTICETFRLHENMMSHFS